jgi:phosphomecalonate degydratase small subunit
MKLKGRCVFAGNIQGEALVTQQAISFFGGIDPETGIVVESGHPLEGQCIAGKVFVFPTGKGSTVGSYTLYRLKHNGHSPLAILNSECETIIAVGCIIAEIPCVDLLPIQRIQTGDQVQVEGEVVNITQLHKNTVSGVQA